MSLTTLKKKKKKSWVLLCIILYWSSLYADYVCRNKDQYCFILWMYSVGIKPSQLT